MAKDYAAISKKIVENIGGVENIASVTHCMTRLRFVVKDEGKINDAAVKATDGVMGVVNQGGQYQIIIGNHVEEAYNEVLKMGDFGEASQVARGEKKEPLTLKKVGNNILDAIVGTMSPLIPAIIGGSMVKLLVMLLGMAGLASRSMVSPSVLTGVQFIDPANPGVSIAWIAGISVLSIVLSFVLTLVIGFEDLPEEE